MGNILKQSYIDVHEAARCGHIEEVRRWIDEGKPVNARDNTQKTPLHYAAQWGQEETLDLLVMCGADVNAVDFIEDSPLHFACYFGHANSARILIKAGAKVDAQDCYGNTPLQIFDDHVTEPVVDEIRLMVREVIRPSRTLQPANSRIMATPRSVECGNNGDLASPPPARSKGPSAERDRESDVTTDSGEAGGTKAGLVKARRKRSVHLDDGSDKIEDVERVDNRNVCQSSRVLSDSNRSQTPGANIRIAAQEQQQQHQQLEQVATKRDEAGCEERFAMDQEAGPAVATPENTFRRRATRGKNGRILPRPSTVLPCDDEELRNENVRSTRRSMGRRATSGGALSAVGGRTERSPMSSGGEAATYSELRPMSAPPLRTGSDSTKLHAMNSGHSGRTCATAAKKNANAAKHRTTNGTRAKGTSLAGTIMAYSTRPGGKLDVFAAARDGQVSVLKRALEGGEKVDARDDNGLTLLMWAARAGRLSTAKYLVSQGAGLGLKDDATGFSALHFATYYCRSSVVRLLLLAGADTRATDNYRRVPGASFQPSSYLSFTAFQQRRAIRRFLSGDLQDGMDDKGKNMFPMNAPLEAYDGDHRPQYVRLASSEKLLAISDKSSDGYDGRKSATNKGSRERVHHLPAYSNRRAYVSMETMNSKGPESFSDDEDETSRVGGAEKNQKNQGTDAQQGNTGVRYYLRRMSLVKNTQENDSYRPDADGNCVDPFGGGRKANHSPPAGDGGINSSLWRTSLEGFLFFSNTFSGVGGDGRNGAGVARQGDGEDVIDPAMAAVVAAATAASPEGARSDASAQSDVSLDRAEAGHWGRRHTDSEKTASKSVGKGTAASGRRMPMEFLHGIHYGAKSLAARFSAKGESYRSQKSRGHRRSSDVGQVRVSSRAQFDRGEEESSPEKAEGGISTGEQQPTMFNSQSEEKGAVVDLSRDREHLPMTSRLPHRRDDSLLPGGGACAGAGRRDRPPCDPVVAAVTTPRPAALAAQRIDPSASTRLPQENVTGAIAEKGATPHTTAIHGSDCLHRNEPPIVAAIDRDVPPAQMQTTAGFAISFDLVGTTVRGSLQASRSDGTAYSAITAVETAEWKVENAVVGNPELLPRHSGVVDGSHQDFAMGTHEHVSTDGDAEVATIGPRPHRDGAVEPGEGLPKAQQPRSRGISHVPGLTYGCEGVDASGQGMSAARRIDAPRSSNAERPELDTLDVKKSSVVGDGSIVVYTPRMEFDTTEIAFVAGSTTARGKEEGHGAARPPFLPSASSRLESTGKLDLEEGASSGSSPPPQLVFETQSTTGELIVSEGPRGEQEDATQKLESSDERSNRKHERRRHRDREKADDSSRSSSRNHKSSNAGDGVTSGDIAAAGDVQHALYPISSTTKTLGPLKRTPPLVHSGLGPTEISQSTTSWLSPAAAIIAESSNGQGDGSLIVGDTGPLPSEESGSEVLLPNDASDQ